MDYGGWVPPENLLGGPRVRTSVVAIHSRVAAGALFDSYYADVSASSWESDKPTFRFGVSHQEARKPVAPLGQTRPWQRYRWQIEDIWRVNDRGEKYCIARPTDPTRLHPKGGRGFLRGDGVSLRCLVCLRLTTGLDYARRKMDTLRDDQVCPECEDDWTQAEEPWGTKYERWVTQRRADRWGPVP